MRVALTPLRQLLAAAAVFVLGSLVTHAAFADGGPKPPISPKSEKECDTWRAEYKAYLDQLHASYQQCSGSDNTPVGNWVPGFSCTAQVVKVPPQCASISSQWDCEVMKFGPTLNACYAAAREADNASKSDELSRDLLNKTASGVPDVAGSNAMRMANLLADQGKATASKAAVQSAIKAYDTTDFIGKFYKLYDPKQSLSEKLKTLADLVPDTAFGKNLLAQDMLKTAIAGLTVTNQTALDKLVKELNTFSAQVARR
jgi:hypothetical protein